VNLRTRGERLSVECADCWQGRRKAWR
jgi:hypothetical protein